MVTTEKNQDYEVRDITLADFGRKELTIAEKEKQSAVELVESNLRSSWQDKLTKKEQELAELKAIKKQELLQSLAEKDSEI